MRWNRKSHSTPYLSEIKRGIYFNFGLPKSTMYRPQMAKMIVTDLNGELVDLTQDKYFTVVNSQPIVSDIEEEL